MATSTAVGIGAAPEHLVEHGAEAASGRRRRPSRPASVIATRTARRSPAAPRARRSPARRARRRATSASAWSRPAGRPGRRPARGRWPAARARGTATATGRSSVWFSSTRLSRAIVSVGGSAAMVVRRPEPFVSSNQFERTSAIRGRTCSEPCQGPSERGSRTLGWRRRGIVGRRWAGTSVGTVDRGRRRRRRRPGVLRRPRRTGRRTRSSGSRCSRSRARGRPTSCG